MSFWGELRRRNVFRVGIAYLAAVWLILQVADIVLPTLGAPDWALPALIYGSVLLFPFVLILAWIYDWTPEGLKVTGEPDETDRPRPRRRTFDIAIIAVMALAIVFLVVDNYVLERAAEPSSAALPSVLVLPFEDLSENEQEWLADGLTEEVLNSLAQLPGLRVIARTTAFQFKDRQIGIPEIAEMLDVTHVVESSVRRDADRLRVTVQLIDAATGLHIWSGPYDRMIDDLFDVQEDIAEQIATALGVLLDDGLRERMFRSGTRNVEAFLNYQQGRAIYKQWHSVFEGSEKTLWDANEFFERAMELDAGYAEAAINHFDAFNHQLMFGDSSSRYTDEQALELLREDLDFAIENASNPTIELVARIWREAWSPTWYQMGGLVRQFVERADTDSITLDIGVDSLLWPWQWLLLFGQFDFVRDIVEQQLTDDPLAGSVWLTKALVEIHAGNLDAIGAIAHEAQEAIGIPLPRMQILTALQQGKRDEALELLSPFGDLPITAAFRGEYGKALELSEAISREDRWLELFRIYYEIGAEDRTRALARWIDGQPAGSVMLASTIVEDGRALWFDLDDTPIFKRKLEQAGIDSKTFRMTPRLSVLEEGSVFITDFKDSINQGLAQSDDR